EVAQVEPPPQNGLLPRLKHARLAARYYQHLNLFRGMHTGVLGAWRQPDQAQHSVAQRVDDPHQGPEEPQREVYRPDDEQGGGLGALAGHYLGHQLAQDYLQDSHQYEG